MEVVKMGYYFTKTGERRGGGIDAKFAEEHLL